MCESGAWISFEVLEDSLTLEDLFILYQVSGERQKRLMKVVGSALGADMSEPEEKEVITGPIVGGDGTTLFAYKQSTDGSVQFVPPEGDIA